MSLTSEIIQRLSADNSNYRSVMNQSVLVAEKTGRAISRGLDIRAGISAVAIAAGLGLNQILQKIADKIAYLWIGWSEAEQKALDETVADSGRVADAMIADLKKVQAEHDKAAEARADALKKQRDLVNEARLAENDRLEEVKRAQEKLFEEEGFAADLEWVKEQDRIAEEHKLKIKSLEEVHAAEMAADAEAAAAAKALIAEKFKSLVDQWKGFEVAVGSKGRGDTELSDRELERKVQLLSKEVRARQQALDTGQTSYDPMLAGQRIQLSLVQGEQKLRSDVRRTVATKGEDAAFMQFNGLTEQKFREITSASPSTADVVAELKKLNGRLRGVLPVNQIPSRF